MSIMPEVYDVEIPDPQEQEEYSDIDNSMEDIPREYVWDFEKNDFLFKDGKFVIVEGVQALRVWIWKALLTERNLYDIYDENYGNDTNKLIGKGYSYELLKTETKRYITECLTRNKFITGISDFAMSNDDSLFYVSFTANTVLGDIDIDNFGIDIAV